jgi:hypothetical protein
MSRRFTPRFAPPLLGAAAMAALGSAGLAHATDSNLKSVETALKGAPVLLYGFGTDAAWSADGGSAFAGGCSGSNGNASQVNASGNCVGSTFGSTASASADLSTGALSASVTVPAVTANGGAAGALMWTTLSFTGAAPGALGTFELPLTGMFTGTSIGIAGLAVNPSADWITSWTLVDATDSSPTLSVTFPILNGTPTKFASGLGVDTVWTGSAAGAALDPPWTLILPSGVTYSAVGGAPTIPGSGSGGGGGGGGSSVPEPGSLGLMLVGCLLSAWSALRTRAPGGRRG